MESTIDLTPFGFTPTESHVYSALLEGGPASGYSVAKRLSIARANAYQALDGLTAKGAAQITGNRPRRYRATAADAVLAQIVERQSRQLDRLEEQVSRGPSSPTRDIVRVDGERAIIELSLRTAARQTGSLWCVGTPAFLTLLAPAWHHRGTHDRVTRIWAIGSGVATSFDLEGEVDPDEVLHLFGGEVFLLVTDGAALAATNNDSKPIGIWSTDPALTGAVRGAIAALTHLAVDKWPES